MSSRCRFFLQMFELQLCWKACLFILHYSRLAGFHGKLKKSRATSAWTFLQFNESFHCREETTPKFSSLKFLHFISRINFSDEISFHCVISTNSSRERAFQTLHFQKTAWEEVWKIYYDIMIKVRLLKFDFFPRYGMGKFFSLFYSMRIIWFHLFHSLRCCCCQSQPQVTRKL